MRLQAIYRGGVFVPQIPCDIPEGAEVDLIIQERAILPPEITDPDEQKRILGIVVERMLQNPIPAEAPRLTRESLHGQ
jgi:predicted DNA-binding antitoxin AbrB/MazE fold protein